MNIAVITNCEINMYRIISATLAYQVFVLSLAAGVYGLYVARSITHIKNSHHFGENSLKTALMYMGQDTF